MASSLSVHDDTSSLHRCQRPTDDNHGRDAQTGVLGNPAVSCNAYLTPPPAATYNHRGQPRLTTRDRKGRRPLAPHNQEPNLLSTPYNPDEKPLLTTHNQEEKLLPLVPNPEEKPFSSTDNQEAKHLPTSHNQEEKLLSIIPNQEEKPFSSTDNQEVKPLSTTQNLEAKPLLTTHNQEEKLLSIVPNQEEKPLPTTHNQECYSGSSPSPPASYPQGTKIQVQVHNSCSDAATSSIRDQAFPVSCAPSSSGVSASAPTSSSCIPPSPVDVSASSPTVCSETETHVRSVVNITSSPVALILSSSSHKKLMEAPTKSCSDSEDDGDECEVVSVSSGSSSLLSWHPADEVETRRNRLQKSDIVDKKDDAEILASDDVLKVAFESHLRLNTRVPNESTRSELCILQNPICRDETYVPSLESAKKIVPPAKPPRKLTHRSLKCFTLPSTSTQHRVDDLTRNHVTCIRSRSLHIPTHKKTYRAPDAKTDLEIQKSSSLEIVSTAAKVPVQDFTHVSGQAQVRAEESQLHSWSNGNALFLQEAKTCSNVEVDETKSQEKRLPLEMDCARDRAEAPNPQIQCAEDQKRSGVDNIANRGAIVRFGSSVGDVAYRKELEVPEFGCTGVLVGSDGIDLCTSYNSLKKSYCILDTSEAKISSSSSWTQSVDGKENVEINVPVDGKKQDVKKSEQVESKKKKKFVKRHSIGVFSALASLAGFSNAKHRTPLAVSNPTVNLSRSSSMPSSTAMNLKEPRLSKTPSFSQSPSKSNSDLRAPAYQAPPKHVDFAEYVPKVVSYRTTSEVGNASERLNQSLPAELISSISSNSFPATSLERSYPTPATGPTPHYTSENGHSVEANIKDDKNTEVQTPSLSVCPTPILHSTPSKAGGNGIHSSHPPADFKSEPLSLTPMKSKKKKRRPSRQEMKLTSEGADSCSSFGQGSAPPPIPLNPTALFTSGSALPRTPINPTALFTPDSALPPTPINPTALFTPGSTLPPTLVNPFSVAPQAGQRHAIQNVPSAGPASSFPLAITTAPSIINSNVIPTANSIFDIAASSTPPINITNAIPTMNLCSNVSAISLPTGLYNSNAIPEAAASFSHNVTFTTSQYFNPNAIATASVSNDISAAHSSCSNHAVPAETHTNASLNNAKNNYPNNLPSMFSSLPCNTSNASNLSLYAHSNNPNFMSHHISPYPIISKTPPLVGLPVPLSSPFNDFHMNTSGLLNTPYHLLMSQTTTPSTTTTSIGGTSIPSVGGTSKQRGGISDSVSSFSHDIYKNNLESPSGATLNNSLNSEDL
ncbi:mucin-17-like [Hyalella azteca]|uniref:Mucin-17-like n=1 Tax=Hyalella azteca TaxID=294128 RepID=A0A8B7PLH9_HYAAZ|nr:mucin-17-like [Hyalella azteca]